MPSAIRLKFEEKDGSSDTFHTLLSHQHPWCYIKLRPLCMEQCAISFLSVSDRGPRQKATVWIVVLNSWANYSFVFGFLAHN